MRFAVGASLLLTLVACGESYDVVLRNGTLYDGSGGPERTGDLAIQGDRIAAVGEIGRARGRLEINVAGMAVAPGFINMLSWAGDSLIARRPLAERRAAGGHAGNLRRGRVGRPADRANETGCGRTTG
jgi:hypothetical protein